MTFIQALSSIVDLLESDKIGKQLNDYYSSLISFNTRDVADPDVVVSVLRRLCKCAQRHICNKIEEPHKKVLTLYEKLLIAIEDRIAPSLETFKLSSAVNDSTSSICLHLLILGAIASSIPVDDAIEAVQQQLGRASNLEDKPIPWLMGPLSAFGGFPFESVTALISFKSQFNHLWKWTSSPLGIEFFLAMQIHSLLHAFPSKGLSLYLEALSTLIDTCGAGNCNFNPVKRRALICYGLAGGSPKTLSLSHPHSKVWLQCAPAQALVSSKELKDAILAGGMQYLVTERSKVVGILTGCGLDMREVLSEANLKKQMKEETNYETVFKLFSICYLENCEALDKQLLKGLILFGEKTMKPGNTTKFNGIIGRLAAEIARRKDTHLDVSKLVSITGASTSPTRHISSLDLCSSASDAAWQLKGALTELSGNGELSLGKRKKICEDLRHAISTLGIVLYFYFALT